MPLTYRTEHTLTCACAVWWLARLAADALDLQAVAGGAAAALAHDRDAHGFDLRAERTRLRLGVYGTVKLVNFMRREVRGGRDPRGVVAAATAEGVAAGGVPWAADDFLAPVIEDDALLFDLYGESDDDEGEGDEGVMPAQLAPAAFEATRRVELLKEAQAAPAELKALAPAPGGAAPAPTPVLVEGGGDADEGEEEEEEAGKAPGGGARQKAAAKAAANRRGTADEKQRDIDYFDSYSHFGIHRTMLGDYARTRAYEEALTRNPSLLRGARVLDVGCGTGVLSCFAAKGGAATVTGVDGSEFIARRARAVVEENTLDGTVRVVQGRVEALTDDEVLGASGERYDVIVSEWMGYGLLFECMLDSVLEARDRWLKPGGAVLPDVARVLVAGGSALAADLPFWEDVHGLSMRSVQKELRVAALKEALVREVAPEAIVTAPVMVKSMDLATMAKEDAWFSSDFELKPSLGGGASPDGVCTISAVVLWFDTDFSGRFCADRPLTLSTSPLGPQTHWVQTVLVLDEDVRLAMPGREAEAARAEPAAAHALRGRVTVTPGQGRRCRSIDVVLEWWAEGGGASDVPVKKTRLYPL